MKEEYLIEFRFATCARVVCLNYFVICRMIWQRLSRFVYSWAFIVKFCAASRQHVYRPSKYFLPISKYSIEQIQFKMPFYDLLNPFHLINRKTLLLFEYSYSILFVFANYKTSSILFSITIAIYFIASNFKNNKA